MLIRTSRFLYFQNHFLLKLKEWKHTPPTRGLPLLCYTIASHLLSKVDTNICKILVFVMTFRTSGAILLPLFSILAHCYLRLSSAHEPVYDSLVALHPTDKTKLSDETNCCKH